MARTSLLVALALAAAPFTAHALGVTKPCDCPGTIDGNGDEILPCGADGEKYEVPPCDVFVCYIDLGEWDPEPSSCEDSDISCSQRGGEWIEPVGDECCGRCSIEPVP